MRILGIDTSNYTTSVAVLDENGYREERTVLTVKEGERGLRQSDALFLHIQNLPALLDKLSPGRVDAVAVSSRPRDVEGSYMPCFLAGVTAGKTAAAAADVPFFSFSHQAGHLMAALKSCGDETALGNEFLAFHLSGGTTELLHVTRTAGTGFAVELLGATGDISAGQLVDRTGVLLGLRFPCGGELEKLAAGATKIVKPHVCVREGNCNLSGAENKIIQMNNTGESPETIARFALDFVEETVLGMSRYAREKFPSLPILYAGGVMRNAYLRSRLLAELPDIFFAETALSSDNAVGICYLGWEAMHE
ncbi:MAG: DNA-binding protein [Ruminococcus sp.]|nr:DNA-binding protein [Candidatus Apopatosoma intestinale]